MYVTISPNMYLAYDKAGPDVIQIIPTNEAKPYILLDLYYYYR